MLPRSSKRQASFCGCPLSTPVPGGKYGGLPVTRSNGTSAPSTPASRKSPSRIVHRSSSPLYRADFRASATLMAWASTVTRRTPGSRQATTVATVPMPLPRSMAVRAAGHHVVPYHAVSRSSVENRCPSRSWKSRKCPLTASRVSSGSTAIPDARPGGTGPGFAQPLKWESGAAGIPGGSDSVGTLRAMENESAPESLSSFPN